MRDRLVNWWLLQRLSWRALVTSPVAMANALKGAALEREGSNAIDDQRLMQQAFADKLAGKTNAQSAAMRELQRRYGL